MVTERRRPRLRRLCIATAAALLCTPGTIAWSQVTAPAAEPATYPTQIPPAPQPNALPTPAARPAEPLRPPVQAWRLEPSIAATILATDNSGYSSAGDENDQVLDLVPRLRIFGQGGRTEVDADLGVHVLRYLQDTQRNRALPDARANLKATLIDRWAYLDARLVSEQTSDDPYSARPDLASSVNRITTNRLRLSPYLDHRFSPSLSLQARSDNAWTRRSGSDDPLDPRRDAFEQRHFLRLAQQSPRLGLAGEVQDLNVSYSGDADDVLSLRGARAVATFGFGPQLQLGLVGGRERSRFPVAGAMQEYSDTVYGLRGLWLPTERTRLRASVENRFFGTGWEAEFTHRSPLWAVQLRTFREPTALPASQIMSPLSTEVASLLDAILTTRHPDPGERRRLVRSMVDGLDLPEILERPIEVYSDRAQLQTGSSASLALLGRRTTATLTLQSLRMRQLTAEGEAAPTPDPSSDNKQVGVGLDVRHRVAPRTTLGVRLRATRLEGLGGATPETDEKTLRLSLTHALSERAAVTVGVRRQMLDSNIRPDARENAVFVGLSQRF